MTPELDDPLGGGEPPTPPDPPSPTSDGISQMIIESETDPIFRVS